MRKVLRFQAEGSGPSAATGAIAPTGAGGVFLILVKVAVVTTPAIYRQDKEKDDEDSCEDLANRTRQLSLARAVQLYLIMLISISRATSWV